MTTMNKPFLDLTVGDLMTRPVESLHQDMTLPAAAGLLRRAGVSGAPVVDGVGRCIGVLSLADLVRWTETLHSKCQPDRREICTCTFLDGDRCMLPVGACSVQGLERSDGGNPVPFCRMPRCVLTDWQVVSDAPPTKKVRDFMTADPVLVTPERPLAEAARMMVDAHIHRVIVVDEERRPVGIVIAADIIAAAVVVDLESEPNRTMMTLARG
jgi:CBS domain-containing protein